MGMRGGKKKEQRTDESNRKQLVGLYQTIQVITINRLNTPK